MKEICNLNLLKEEVNNIETPQERYSSAELAEMMNTHPEQLFNVDIAACTDWYTNDDFIEDILSKIDEKRMDDFIKFILTMHEYQTVTIHHPKVCYRVTDERKYAPYVNDLGKRLDAMRVRVLHSREVTARMEEMIKTWSSTWTSDNSTSSTEVPPAPPLPSGENATIPPQFAADSTDNTIEYHLSDLPDDVQTQILIDDDKRYSVFVNKLHGPVNQWIGDHRLQDWNVVRFICRLRGLVTKHCSLNIFGKFLEHIGLGNQENNMKQRKDANDKNLMVAYDNPKSTNPEVFALRKDGKKIEELLADVIETEAA